MCLSRARKTNRLSIIVTFIQERLKRRRKEEYERQCEELERREQLHNEIDRNMEKVRLKEKAAKQVPFHKASLFT